MKKNLGQFFTKSKKIQDVFGKLTLNKSGTILEPSVGEGHLLFSIPLSKRNLVVVEYDKNLKNKLIAPIASYKNLEKQYGCFFEAKIPKNITTIISNPPYVSSGEYKNFMSTGMKKFIKTEEYKGKYNITYFFIHKCAQLLEKNGEMIFVVPKDFSYATSAVILREYLKSNGHFTHWIDCGEEQVFDDASLETLVIFRWKKSENSGETTKYYGSLDDFNTDKSQVKEEMFLGINKMILFVDKSTKAVLDSFVSLSTILSVSVGSVSGADYIFKVNKEFKTEENEPALNYFNSGANKKDLFINTTKFNSFEELPESVKQHLLLNKDSLLKRFGIDEDSWWKWSFLRNARVSLNTLPEEPRIFTFSKTRAENPFVIGDSDGFVGSVYGLFPKNKDLNLTSIIDILNSDFYRNLYRNSGLAVGNKFQATPSAIKDIPIPPKEKIEDIAFILKNSKNDTIINDMLLVLKK